MPLIVFEIRTVSAVMMSPSGSKSLDSTEVAPPVIVFTVPPSNTVMASCTETGGFVFAVN